MLVAASYGILDAFVQTLHGYKSMRSTAAHAEGQNHMPDHGSSIPARLRCGGPEALKAAAAVLASVEP